MAKAILKTPAAEQPQEIDLLIDPRDGDVEDDASSTKRRSLLAIAGSLLSEISLPRLALAWFLLILLPVGLLGLAPPVISAWAATLSQSARALLTGVTAPLVVALMLAMAWMFGRRLFRIVEQSFWSLNSIAIQPFYAAWREGLRHLADILSPGDTSPETRGRLRAAAAACAGLIMAAISITVIALAWPHTHWVGQPDELLAPFSMIMPALANSLTILSACLGAGALVWGFADAFMPQPCDLPAFDAPPPAGRRWRVAHLSDLHMVGERYGFRIESGRSGPRGNGAVMQTLDQLVLAHARAPLDLVLVTGDMTDAGRSAEWGEFITLLAQYPALTERMLILPGNHDLNVVDRANPARLDLPTSPVKRLRQMRTLSMMAGVQGDRVLCGANTLNTAVASAARTIRDFSDAGGIRRSIELAAVWDDVFPMVMPPKADDGLGVILLNSNAETHFSFTNALGAIPVLQARKVIALLKAKPRARWLIGLHHHMVEYPAPASAFSERIGTALINGSWFVRQLLPFADRIVVMHGHRHIDWIGACGGLRIISAPSPVMEQPHCFYIHTLAQGQGDRLALLTPERIDVLPESN